MPRASKIVIALLYLVALATAPWLMVAIDAPDSTISRICVGLILAGIIYLFVVLLLGKSIPRLLSDAVHEKSKSASFSFLRVGYLVGIYSALASAILGLIAWTLLP